VGVEGDGKDEEEEVDDQDDDDEEEEVEVEKQDGGTRSVKRGSVGKTTGSGYWSNSTKRGISVDVLEPQVPMGLASSLCHMLRVIRPVFSSFL
jgi:hypothetical protein